MQISFSLSYFLFQLSILIFQEVNLSLKFFEISKVIFMLRFNIKFKFLIP